MTGAWNDYAELLEEAAGLASQVDREVVEVESRHAHEARRLQGELATMQSNLKALELRNSRLQAGVRDLVRVIGVSAPAPTAAAPVPPAQLAEAMKSAEYDLDQIRRSWDSLKASQQARSVPTVTPPPPPPPTAQAEVPAERARPRVAVLLGLVLGVILIVVLAMIVL